MPAALLAGLAAGLAIAMPVGVVATYLVTLTARSSWRVGAAAALGIATADTAYATAAVVGGSKLAELIEPLQRPLRWVSALVLGGIAVRGLWLASQTYRSGAAVGPVLTSTNGVSLQRAYGSLLAMTLLNPATVVYFAALVAGGRAGGSGVGDSLLFVLGVGVASSSWQLVLVSGGTALGRVLTGHRGRAVTGVVSSLVIAVLAVVIALG